MQQLKTNAEFCGSLPLHLINQIQDYGVLLVADHSGMLIQVSQNAEQLLKADPADICETALAHWLEPASAQKLEDAVREGQSKVLLTLSFKGGGEYPAMLHLKESYNLLEVELQEASARPFLHHYEELKQAMTAINAAASIEELCETAVRALKRRSGFDHIMAYRFDPDWNGTVIAEVKEEGVSSYLGLRFPPSDIPKQARDLYMRTPYRLIPNREYQPVKLYPIVNPLTNTFTDLFDCNLRSVAGVHLEYLKNMGVMSSMSTRILKDGVLWGLISCHHRSAKMPTREQCALFELLSEVISARLAALENQAMLAGSQELNTSLAAFVERLYRSAGIPGAVLHDDIAQQLHAGGMAYVNGEETRTIGNTPGKALLTPLVFWLQNCHGNAPFTSRSLAAEYEEGEAFSAIGSGLLSIPIRAERGEYVLVFRPEEPEEVAWGGNPEEALQMEADGKTYHPRASFRQWQQTVRGQSRPWDKQDLLFARELRNAVNDFLLQQLR